MFRRRLILLATPRHVGVLDWGPGRMHWLGEFSATPKGLAAFRAVIAGHAQRPVLLVADTVDEDYRSEALPHVAGHARAEMLARKLRQVFRNVRFAGAWRQARESAGRRDDRYLLVALTEADWLAPWLGILRDEHAPLCGIAPLALAHQHLLRRLRIQAPHVLLAYRLGSRLRLSYYQDGLLRFSRLIGSDTPTQMPGGPADEIAKTQLYLAGQRILPRDALLHVLMIDPSGQLDTALAPLNADPAFSARLIELPALARALRIPPDFLATAPEIAPLAAIGGEALQVNLAPPQLLRRHAEFTWRRGLNAAAGLVAAGGLAVTTLNALDARALHAQARLTQAQTRSVDARHAAIVRDFPALATRPDQLSRTLALAATLKRAPFDANALLAPLGQALTLHPELIVRSLTVENAAAGTARITLDAQLSEFDGNYRAAMARIDSLASRLSATPGVTAVERVASPIDLAPGATLSGGTSDASAPGDTRFSLRIEVRT